MKKLVSCEFNFDTVCIELKFSDGSMVAIDTIAVKMRLHEICMNGQNLTTLSTMRCLNTIRARIWVMGTMLAEAKFFI